MGEVGAVAKFLESLTETVREWVKPNTMKRLTAAECDRIEQIARAEANASVVKAEGDAEAAEVLHRMRERIITREFRRQVTIEEVCADAAKLLPASRCRTDQQTTASGLDRELF